MLADSRKPAHVGDERPTDVISARAQSVQPRRNWLRRAGAGRVLKTLGDASAQIRLPQPPRSRAWLNVALIECDRCHQVEQRRSPIQRHCAACTADLRRQRSKRAMARRRSERG
jgi:hypothetical protein